ncbi:MAG: TssN family type VI secretion system protein [Paludibacteraceae bacterium]|nr:TssN family type VI secretion system protein [Paludibacteraceae bacterium]
MYGWIFYTKPSFFRPRKYLDPDLSFADNKFKENQLIIAKRVRQVSE